MAKNLKTLLRNIFAIDVHDDTMLLGIAYDSRQVLPGECFCAYPGYATDGRQYIEQAIKNGASAILVDHDKAIAAPTWECYKGKKVPIYKVNDLQQRLGQIAAWFYGYPSLHMKVIAVTGTNGKTSYCHMLAEALSLNGFKTAILGSLGYGKIGQLKPTLNTTLNAVDNQKILAEFRDQGVEYVIMEVSSHALDQGRVNGIGFHFTAFTNISQDHLDYHGTMQAYKAAKRKLFDNDTTAIINIDDEFGKELANSLPKVICYSAETMSTPGKSVVANNIHCYQDHTEVTFTSFEGGGSYSTQLIGRYNAYNTLAVLASLLKLDVSLTDACDTLSKLSTVPGRLQVQGGGDLPTVYLDFAHTPDALHKTLKALRQINQGKLFCVFGCGGNRDKSKRSKMAAVAEAVADHCIVTTDNPRFEDINDVVADIQKGFSQNKHQVVLDRKEAIKAAVDRAAPGDVILVAGKGCEEWQEINGYKVPYSDAESISACLEEKACFTP